MVKKDKDLVFIICPHAYSEWILRLYYLQIWMVKKKRTRLVVCLYLHTKSSNTMFYCYWRAAFAVSIIEFSSKGNIVILLFYMYISIFLLILYLSRKPGYACMLPFDERRMKCWHWHYFIFVFCVCVFDKKEKKEINTS